MAELSLITKKIDKIKEKLKFLLKTYIYVAGSPPCNKGLSEYNCHLQKIGRGQLTGANSVKSCAIMGFQLTGVDSVK